MCGELAKQKPPMTQNPVCNEETLQSPLSPPQALRPRRFSALVANYALKNGIESNDNCFAGNDGDESDADTSDNDSDSDDEVYTCLP